MPKITQLVSGKIHVALRSEAVEGTKKRALLPFFSLLWAVDRQTGTQLKELLVVSQGNSSRKETGKKDISLLWLGECWGLGLQEKNLGLCVRNAQFQPMRERKSSKSNQFGKGFLMYLFWKIFDEY